MSEISGTSPVRKFNTSSQSVKPEVPKKTKKELSTSETAIGKMKGVNLETHRKALAHDIKTYHQKASSSQLKKTHKKIESFIKLLDKVVGEAEDNDTLESIVKITTDARLRLAQVFKEKGMDDKVIHIVAQHQIPSVKEGSSYTAKEISSAKEALEKIILAWSQASPIV